MTRPYLSADPEFIITSQHAKIVDPNSGKTYAVIGNDMNFEGIAKMEQIGIQVPDKYYYFVIDLNKEVVWHSKRKYTGEYYSLTQYIFSNKWEPEQPENPSNNETRDFLLMIDKEISNMNVNTSYFIKNGKKELYAKAPINVKGSNEQTFFVFLCINVDQFTKGVLEIQIIEGKTLATVIVFAIALIIVIFITYGISYEVSALIFRPLKLLLRRLRNMQF